MRHEVLSISLFDGHTRNYRQHPDEQVARLAASLDRFKQVRSIVVKAKPDGRYTILAGHGVVLAAQKRNFAEIACDIVPDEWDEATCTAYLIADNQHAQGASDDETMLAQLLQEQVNSGYDLASLGSDEETLRQMLANLGDSYLAGDDTPPDVQFKEFDETIADDLKTELCQQCGKLCLKGKADA